MQNYFEQLLGLATKAYSKGDIVRDIFLDAYKRCQDYREGFPDTDEVWANTQYVKTQLNFVKSAIEREW